MRTRRFFFSGLALIGAASLSACGFSPMYGTGSPGEDLSEIRIQTGSERVDFYLQEALHDALGTRNARGPYTLITETRRSRLGLGVSTNEEARRYAVRVSVTYRLMRDGVSRPAFTGIAEGEAGFNASSELYSIEIAERDAETRAVEAAAEQMTLQLYRFARSSETW
ncbi:MAG: hypothetical protein GYB36_04290 [Alphaproteobacteria bacterium]|nr:hypothetical protein [Alphaproteobacteria bacterium]